MKINRNQCNMMEEMIMKRLKMEKVKVLLSVIIFKKIKTMQSGMKKYLCGTSWILKILISKEQKRGYQKLLLLRNIQKLT